MQQSALARTPPSSPHDDDVRQRLLVAATALFARKGYAATTVREIVDAAGVTKPVLYYYFEHKEALFLGIVNEALAEHHALLDRVAAGGGSPRERLVLLATSLFDMFVQRLEVVRVINSVFYGPPQGAPPVEYEACHRKAHETVQRLVREGIRRGEFRAGNVEDMTWAVLGILSITLDTQLCHPERSPGRAGLQRLLGLLFTGLETPRATRRPGAGR